MGELKKYKLECPKCGGTLFEVYLVECSGVLPIGGTLTFYMWECSECGWKSHPEDVDELRKFLYEVLVKGGEKNE
jgi:C4-type Zn-finger protein